LLKLSNFLYKKCYKLLEEIQNIYIFISWISLLVKRLMSTLGHASDSPGTQFPENRQETPSLTLGVTRPRTPVERPLEEPGAVGEPSVVVSQLCRRREESGLQPDLELARQCQRTITEEQHLLIWLRKRDATLDYAKTNNLHVMWSGGVIDTCDGHDLVNVVFQSRHLNRIMAGLEMSGPFRDLHREDREDLVMSATRALGNFLIHEERL
jgi:hypothetical protein